MLKNYILGAVAVSCLAAVYGGPAAAQANRTFVSGQGSDSNPCSLGAPCRSFAQAITQTNAGGEIAVLDTAGYGPVTITKAISIVAPDGVIAGVTTSSATPGITITAGVLDTVNLRGLTLEGGGVGTNGIFLTSGGNLNIANCVVRNFSNVGIFLAPSPASPANYTVVDTTVANNPAVGIYLAPPSGNITGQLIALFLKRDLLIANGDGLRLNAGLNNSFQGSLEATLVDVAASDNLNNAFAFHSNAPLAAVTGVVHNSQETDSPVGLLVDNSAVWLERSLLDSPTSFTISGGFGFIYSAGDNRMTGFPSMGSQLSSRPLQ